MERDATIVTEIIARHGKTIDLEASPETIIQIIREYGPELDVEVFFPPSPARPDPTIRDVMAELLKLSREVHKIRQQLGA
jgi:hypothetical protein